MDVRWNDAMDGLDSKDGGGIDPLCEERGH
jgi:hypothetical protein